MTTPPLNDRPAPDDGWPSCVEVVSLRDYFAAKAMEALIPVGASVYQHEGKAFWDTPTGENVSTLAYEYADAMLKARGEQR
jgi:hypothetical protein